MNAYLEIDLDKIGNNIKNIVNKSSDYKYKIAVLKANAYAHGMYIVNTLVENGVNYIAVSNIYEAIMIRKYNKKIPILCLEPIDISYIDDVIKYNITITIHSIDYLKSLKNKENIKCHIKVDTGMNRLGIKTKNEFNEVYDLINKNKYLELEGIFTHFMTTGITDDIYNKQIDRFKLITSDIDLNKIPIIHMGSGFDLVNHKKIDICNGIRFGTIIYGYDVSVSNNSDSFVGRIKGYRREYIMRKNNIDDIIFNNDFDLKPALELKSRVLQVKKLSKDELATYGGAYKASGTCYIATIGIGYESGIGTSNISVVINNKKYKSVGSVSMCMMNVLVDSSVKEGDIVYLIGNGITLGEFARNRGVSVHEALTSIDRFLPRVYTKNNKVDFIWEAK